MKIATCFKSIMQNIHLSLLVEALLLLLAAAFTTTVSGRLIDSTLNLNQQRDVQQEYLRYRKLQNSTLYSCEDVYSINPKARESQSCSIGITMQFVGPIQTWSDVKTMLKARSFKGEIILIHETRADAAMQWIWRMLRMGYAHTVVLSRGEHACTQLRKLYGAELGCVWFPRSISYSTARASQSGLSSVLQPLLGPQEVAVFSDEPGNWRLQLTAMVLRLGGYNVLGLDTDILLQDDFYWWMRQPDYKDYHLMVQRDGMWGPSPMGPREPNLGVMYARGASPSGPTAWALAEGLLRNIRWLEQPQLPATFNSTMTTCWEHAVVTDSIYSALVGRPIFWRCLESRQLDPTWTTRDDGRKRFLDANMKLIEPELNRKVFDTSRPGPACHIPLVGNEGLWSMEGRLKVPHFRGQWPEVLGGRALGDNQGPVTRAFLQMMKEAGTPLWLDPEDPTAEAAIAQVPAERFAHLSRHLVCDWASCGSQGMFFLRQPSSPGARRGLQSGSGGRELQEPCVVLGHLGITPDKPLGKRLQLMVNGHYNMDVMAAVHGPGGPYFATNTHLSGVAHHSSIMRSGMMGLHARRGHVIPAPKVIALMWGAVSPRPDPASAATASGSRVLLAGGGGGGSDVTTAPLVLRSKAHMISVIRALSSVAVAVGRTLGLPKLSCDYAWMHRTGDAALATAEAFLPFNGSHRIPWTYLEGQAFAPYGPSLEALSCEWLAWAQHGCLHGPLHMERAANLHVNPHPAARMLLSYEMDYLVRQLPPEETTPRAVPAAAAAAGTGIGGRGGNLLRVPTGSVAGPDGVVNVTMAQVSEQLSRIDSEQLLIWMERPMRVVDLPGQLRAAHEQWVTHCCGLSWPQSRNHICFWDF